MINQLIPCSSVSGVWAVGKIRDILRISMDPMSLESPVGNGEDSTELGDFIEDPSVVEPDDAASKELLRGADSRCFDFSKRA